MKLNEDIFDDIVLVEIPDVVAPIEAEDTTPPGPEVGEATGIADMILDLINDENEAIKGYNDAKANITCPDFAKVIDDIAAEEMNHVGMLQTLLKKVSPNAEVISQGEEEAENMLQENLENVERTLGKNPKLEIHGEMPITMADAVIESEEADEEADKRLKDLKKFADKPFLGATEQPTPEKPVLPKITLDESLFEDVLTERNWKTNLINGKALRKAIDDEDYNGVRDTLIACYKEIAEKRPDVIEDEYELNDYIESIEILDANDDDIEDSLDYELSEFYDLCDANNIWVNLYESINESLQDERVKNIKTYLEKALSVVNSYLERTSEDDKNESLKEDFYIHDEGLADDWIAQDLTFDVDQAAGFYGIYEFETAAEAKEALKTARSHGYRDAWRETNKVYISGDKLKESISEKKLYKDAEDIADRLSVFLDASGRIENLEDYLDEYDLDNIGGAMDALYYFSHAYAEVEEPLQEGRKAQDFIDSEGNVFTDEDRFEEDEDEDDLFTQVMEELCPTTYKFMKVTKFPDLSWHRYNADELSVTYDGDIQVDSADTELAQKVADVYGLNTRESRTGLIIEIPDEFSPAIL